MRLLIDEAPAYRAHDPSSRLRRRMVALLAVFAALTVLAPAATVVWNAARKPSLDALDADSAIVALIDNRGPSVSDCEVDFVLARGGKAVAVEVKSGPTRKRPAGLDAFAREFPSRRMLLVGSGGIPVEEFIQADPRQWF